MSAMNEANTSRSDSDPQTPEGEEADARWDTEGGAVEADPAHTDNVPTGRSDQEWRAENSRHWHNGGYTPETQARSDKKP